MLSITCLFSGRAGRCRWTTQLIQVSGQINACWCIPEGKKKNGEKLTCPFKKAGSEEWQEKVSLLIKSA